MLQRELDQLYSTISQQTSIDPGDAIRLITLHQLLALEAERDQIHQNDNTNYISPDQEPADPYNMGYHGTSLSEWMTRYNIPYDTTALKWQQHRDPGTRTRTGSASRRRRHHHHRDQQTEEQKFQKLLKTPYKYVIDPILDNHDGSILADLINSDSSTAWKEGIRLCHQNQHNHLIPYNLDTNTTKDDIIFFTDASSRRITESKSDRDKGVNQWTQMQANPAEWRSGVAIAWDISPSSPLYNSSEHTNTNTNKQSLGSRLMDSTKSKTELECQWTAPNEAAWQISGLQHFNQAELLGILFALERAVTIYREHAFQLNNNDITSTTSENTLKLSKSITILTDSKPAMWDLTGSNWHTDSIATESEYWTLRRENTTRIVEQAKLCLKFLRAYGVAVKIRWVPGHSGIPGNEWVDKLSRFVRLLPSRFNNTSFTPIYKEERRDDPMEDGWRQMCLNGVDKEVIVDTGLGIHLAAATQGRNHVMNEHIQEVEVNKNNNDGVIAAITGETGIPELREFAEAIDDVDEGTVGSASDSDSDSELVEMDGNLSNGGGDSRRVMMVQINEENMGQDWVNLAPEVEEMSFE